MYYTTYYIETELGIHKLKSFCTHYCPILSYFDKIRKIPNLRTKNFTHKGGGGWGRRFFVGLCVWVTLYVMTFSKQKHHR